MKVLTVSLLLYAFSLYNYKTKKNLSLMTTINMEALDEQDNLL